MRSVRFLFVEGNLIPWSVEISHFRNTFFGRHFRPNFDKDFIVFGKIAQGNTNKMRPIKLKLSYRKLRYSQLDGHGTPRHFELFQRLISQERLQVRTKVDRLFLCKIFSSFTWCPPFILSYDQYLQRYMQKTEIRKLSISQRTRNSRCKNYPHLKVPPNYLPANFQLIEY